MNIPTESIEGINADEYLKKRIDSQEWRLNNLYWIENKNGELVRFHMNVAQEQLFKNLHFRNEILKARQWGISTFVALLILDCCLFNKLWRAGIIDKTLDDAKLKVGKIALAYQKLDYLPPGGDAREAALADIGAQIKKAVPLTNKGASFMGWNNGSSIRASTSMRGGTLQLLHVSELGHVAAHNPQRAIEIINGGINAITSGMYVIKESTHEGGKQGLNYEGIKAALSNEGRKDLSPLDFRFFFFTWWKNPEYELDARYWEDAPEGNDGLARRQRLNEYFERLENQGIKLDSRKKAWYENMEKTLSFSIKQEYPSTVEEAFEQMAERAIYATELNIAQQQGRIDAQFEPDGLLPTYVSWDLGRRDLTTMWLSQIGSDGKFYILDHYAQNRQTVDHYIAIAREWEARYRIRITRHILPHDGNVKGWDGISFADWLDRAGFSVLTLKVARDVWAGINAARRLIGHCVFHERCSCAIRQGTDEWPSGIDALGKYQTAPLGANGVMRAEPLHDIYSHSADSFRYLAEAKESGLLAEEGSGGYASREATGERIRAVGTEWLDEFA